MKTYLSIIQTERDPVNPRREFENVGTLMAYHPKYDLGDNDCTGDPPPTNFIDFLLGEIGVPGMEGFYIDDDGVLMDRHGNELGLYEASVYKTQAEDWARNNVCMLPVYLYDHSGLSMSTSPYSCPWDSGQVGFIYCTRHVADNHGIAWERVPNMLKAEIATMDAYLSGEVYGYILYDISDLAPEKIEELQWLVDPVGYAYAKVYLLNGVQHGEDINRLTRAAEEVDSCWGFYGYEYAQQVALAAFEHMAQVEKDRLDKIRSRYFCM